MSPAYAELVREYDSPHVPRTPSRSFVTMLTVLAEAGTVYVAQVVKATAVDPATASRGLARMERLGLATSLREAADVRDSGRAARRYYTVTRSGLALAAALADEAGPPPGPAPDDVDVALGRCDEALRRLGELRVHIGYLVADVTNVRTALDNQRKGL